MFKKEKTLLLAACASAETNNLAVWLDGRKSESVAVIHGDRVSLTPASGTELKARLLTCLSDKTPAMVTQVWLSQFIYFQK